MEVENILAKNITAAGEKAAYDACCKRILANKIISVKDTRISGEPEKGAKTSPEKQEIFGEDSKMSKAANSL